MADNGAEGGFKKCDEDGNFTSTSNSTRQYPQEFGQTAKGAHSTLGDDSPHLFLVSIS